jgi:hypothetical protein
MALTAETLAASAGRLDLLAWPRYRARVSSFSMQPRPTFSQRLDHRLRLWWGYPPRRGEWLTFRYRPHQMRERYTRRRRDEADDVWRCCALWQRTLINKWNSREFAVKHGARVPALYWCARLPSRRRLRRLPEQFVLRPVAGTSRQGVYVVAHGRDLLRNAPFTGAEVRRSILRAGKMAWTIPILAEELVRSDDADQQLPVEYKCHTFGDVIAAVQVIERTGLRAQGHRFYTPDWRPFSDPMNTDVPEAELRNPPRCLNEMLELAARLGTAIGTYMRVDFFASDAGCVFNEFASTPRHFTPFCDQLFGALWDDKFPSAS